MISKLAEWTVCCYFISFISWYATVTSMLIDKIPYKSMPLIHSAFFDVV